MSLTFQNFKEEIASQILQRGRAYYRGGNITDLEMEDEGSWSAQVSGTEDYDVTVKQLTGGDMQCTCTCPFDQGPYCKHSAAVLYAIEEAFPEVIGSRKSKVSTAKRGTKEEKLSKALSKVSREELVAVLLELAKNKQIASQLMLRFGAVSPDKASVARAIKDALRAHMDHGFIDYYASGRAARAVEQLIDRADQLG